MYCIPFHRNRMVIILDSNAPSQCTCRCCLDAPNQLGTSVPRYKAKQLQPADVSWRVLWEFPVHRPQSDQRHLPQKRVHRFKRLAGARLPPKLSPGIFSHPLDFLLLRSQSRHLQGKSQRQQIPPACNPASHRNQKVFQRAVLLRSGNFLCSFGASIV